MTDLLTPLVTIMIPVYNGERFVEDAVRSALSQPLRNLEVLLLDDGSTDGTPLICDELAAHDPRVIVSHHENVGLGENRNMGYPLVRGRWLVFLDHDDVLVPGVLSDDLADALSLCEEAGVGMVVTSRARGDSRLESLVLDPAPLDGVHESLDGCSWQLPYELATNLYRTDVVVGQDIRFATSRPEMESIFRHQAAYLSGRVAFCPDAALEIRRGSEEQITRTWNRLRMRAVRIAGYSSLPDWHRAHGDVAADVARAYDSLSGTIVDFFRCAAMERASLDDMAHALDEASVPAEALEPSERYGTTANRMLSLYRRRSATGLRTASVAHGAAHLLRKATGRTGAPGGSRSISRDDLARMASDLPHQLEMALDTTAQRSHA